MPILDRLKRAVTALAKPDAGQAAIASATIRPYEVASVTQRFRRRDSAELVGRFMGTVKVAASRNAMAVASLPLRVYRQQPITGDKRTSFQTVPVRRKSFATAGRIARKSADTGYDLEEVVDPLHPLVQLLQQVNSRDNGFSLIEDSTLWLGLAGNAYWYMPMPGPPEALWPLAPQFVHAIPNRQSFIEAYVYGRGLENETRFEAEEICHFRNPNPLGSPYYGRGDLESCIEEADLSRSFVQYALATINNGAQPGMVFSSDQWVTNEQVEQARMRYEEMYQGRWKAGRSLFLNGKVEVKPWSLSEKEMAFLQSSERIDQVIANCFDMPVSILRLDTAALATAKAAIPQWQLMAIRPRAQRIEDQINQRLVKPWWPDLFACFDEAVDEDEEATSVRIAALYTADLLTKNEARGKLGEDDIGPEGDKFVSEVKAEQAQVQAAQAAETAAARVGAGGGRQNDNSGDNLGKGIKLAGALALSASAMLWSPNVRACCHDHPRVVVKDDRLSITASEHTLESALRSFFRGQTPKVLDAVRADGSLAMDLGPDSEFAEAMGSQVNRLLEALYDAGARAGVRDLEGKADDPAALTSALTERASGFVSRFGGKMIVSVGDTLSTRIEGELSDGIDAGESISQLTARVAEVMSSVSTVGAERIARTETSRAFLSAREEAWKESGIVSGKRWLLSADPCPICRTIAASVNATTGVALADAFMKMGETIALIGGGEFTHDYGGDMLVPPAHPNCRCSTGAVFNL